MMFTIWIKYHHGKRFSKRWTTFDSKRAEKIANFYVQESYREYVKVVCYDGYTTETLWYKKPD